MLMWWYERFKRRLAEAELQFVKNGGGVEDYRSRMAAVRDESSETFERWFGSSVADRFSFGERVGEPLK